MSFEKHKEILNRELDRVNTTLSEILERYLVLIKKQDITDEELSELGEIEHGLIEINSKMAAIKKRLDENLFGETMNQYYLLKSKAKKGDLNAKKKLDQLRSTITDSVSDDTFFNWN